MANPLRDEDDPKPLLLAFVNGIPKQLPGEGNHYHESLWHAFWEGEAAEIVNEMAARIPGALFDAILVAMMEKKTSLLHVPHQPEETT